MGEDDLKFHPVQIINSTISIAIAIGGGIFAWSSSTVTSILSSTLVSYITTLFSSKMTVDTTSLVNNIISIVRLNEEQKLSQSVIPISKNGKRHIIVSISL
ncbi:hypothetical protein Smp_139990 [Schistosoma mansoni]|uniref:hypothetical protein n=1 Tax=Schistosoma mansoni TaxID=6183 RepID=UPI0001A638E4|nr:hypothetical protein Smp_139990 [Schistosoma mansoni]|eukprot:XP_018653607.1 hypothetical protein Smp_139990 [Schistosoma mansoni]